MIIPDMSRVLLAEMRPTAYMIYSNGKPFCGSSHRYARPRSGIIKSEVRVSCLAQKGPMVARVNYDITGTSFGWYQRPQRSKAVENRTKTASCPSKLEESGGEDLIYTVKDGGTACVDVPYRSCPGKELLSCELLAISATMQLLVYC